MAVSRKCDRLKKKYFSCNETLYYADTRRAVYPLEEINETNVLLESEQSKTFHS